MTDPINRSVEEPSVFSPAARQYALGVLVVVYTFNFIDRQILSILLEPIKQDLGLSDSALGLLTGFAFALFYATLGIPIARYADKGNRRNLIALALAIWSAMTALSGLAQNFWQLLAARIGVGVGEAGCSPPAHSMIADYFPAHKRATALGIYSSAFQWAFCSAFSLAAGSTNFSVGGWPSSWSVCLAFFSPSSFDTHYVNRPGAWQKDASIRSNSPGSKKRSNSCGANVPSGIWLSVAP